LVPGAILPAVPVRAELISRMFAYADFILVVQRLFCYLVVKVRYAGVERLAFRMFIDKMLVLLAIAAYFFEEVDIQLAERLAPIKHFFGSSGKLVGKNIADSY
jgi:hypothetical protein